MGIILSQYSDSLNKIDLNSDSGIFLPSKLESDNGYFEFLDGACCALYPKNGNLCFYNGSNEIYIINDIFTEYLNSLNEKISIFSIYQGTSKIFSISYEAWWASEEGEEPPPFICEARTEDIDYDFFAYVHYIASDTARSQKYLDSRQ